MQRITARELHDRAERVSAQLVGFLYVAVSERNGHTALDLCDEVGTIKMLTAGTKREVGAYLTAMSETLAIVGR